MSEVTQLPRPTHLSGPVVALSDAVAALRELSPAELPGPQALTECGVLLAELERLKTLVLTRVADVDRRGLYALDDAPSTATWIARQDSGLHRREVTLARRLDRHSHLAERVGDGLGLDAAARIAGALCRLRPHVDQPHGLIDGQPAAPTLRAVAVDGALSVICQAKGGLADDHPLLRRLHGELTAAFDCGGSGLQILERAFVIVAVHTEPAQLPGALDQLIDALLPLQLEDAADRAHRDRRLTLTRQHGSAGWLLRGELDLETGELLHTALRAAQATDPGNPTDTVAWAAHRATGADPDDIADRLGCQDAPRSRRQQQHDALRLVLRALLDSAALGTRGKAAPHIGVTVGLDTLHGIAGALPARSDSGRSLPLGLVRSWLCDSHLTRYVLSLGRKVIDLSHTERTATAAERKIKNLETGGQCQGAGCSRGPDLIPHHVTPWATCHTTRLDDTIWICEQTHQDLHAGGKTLTLKDGRRLDQHGWIA